MIARAYKAIQTLKLETEVYVLPIDIYLDSLAARFQERLENSGQA